MTALVLALALALGACGDDEEPATTATEEAVTGTTGPQAEETVPAEPPADDSGQQEGTDEGEPAADDPEEAIRATLNGALASGDPRLACEEAVTDAYVREAYGSPQGCRAAQGGEALADELELEDIEVEGSRASGVVRFEGGTYGGEPGDVELVLEGNAWKLESLEVNVPAGP